MAGKAKEETEIAGEKEQIHLAYTSANMNANLSSGINLFETIKTELNWEKANYTMTGSSSMIIKSENGNEYTLIKDGTILDGKVAYLDIADGNIDLYSDGYKQYTGSLQRISSTNSIPYIGNYVITGASTENVVRVCDVGTYNITIKDLTIDVSSIDGLCAFNGNRGEKATECFVNLMLEGKNTLKGGSGAAGLGFSKGTPNVDGVTNGSTLTIQGNGSLKAQGGLYSAGVGGGGAGVESSGGDANNIIINSGNITTKGGIHGSGIGAGLYYSCNNIIMNGGEITAYGNFWGAGIGASDSESVAKNIAVNGGNIYIYSASGSGIGATNIENITINGGRINIYKTNFHTSTQGVGCIGGNGDVIINGGTLVCNALVNNVYGIYSNTNEITINGGSLKVNTRIGTELINAVPKMNNEDAYLTSIQLKNVTEEVKITGLTTSDKINYGITDMYCSSDDETTEDTNEGGMLYLYLPQGTRTITIQANGKTYSGTVETKEENDSIVVLNEN